MAQVSKYPISQAVYEQIFELLLKVFSDSSSKEEASNLLNDLLTPTEKIVLSKRLAVALLLSKKYLYEDIKKILRVSQPTIALVNMTLKYKGKGYKHFSEKILKEEKIREIWEGIEETVLKTLSTGKGSGTWRYLHHELKNKQNKRKL